MDLQVFREIPDFLPSCESTELVDSLGAPTLIDLRQCDEPPLFISSLLHGNETSSWVALRSLMAEWLRKDSVPSCMVFIGNVFAAKHKQRCLREQPDYNRIWEGGETRECKLAEQVVNEIRKAEPWLVVDIHNNSGPNPHYSVITDTKRHTLSIASLFSRLAIYARHPKGILTRRTSEICPSITIEVGVPSNPMSAVRARQYVDRLTKLHALPDRKITDLKVYRSRARVTIDETDGNADPDLANLDAALDHLSFDSIPHGYQFYRRHSADLLRAWDESGDDVSDDYFEFVDEYQVLKKDVVLSMYTRDPFIARQDCLCYFLEPEIVQW